MNWKAFGAFAIFYSPENGKVLYLVMRGKVMYKIYKPGTYKYVSIVMHRSRLLHG